MLNTAPSFGSKSTMAGQVAGQRAAQRRSAPSNGMQMRPGASMAGAAATSRRASPGKSTTMNSSGASIGPSPFMNFGYKASGLNPMSFGYNPGGGKGTPMGGSPAPASMPPPPPPMRTQAPPLMDANASPSPTMGGGLVANNAPNMFNQQEPMGSPVDRLRQKMGGNTGITGGLERRPGMFQMYDQGQGF